MSKNVDSEGGKNVGGERERERSGRNCHDTSQISNRLLWTEQRDQLVYQGTLH